MASEVAKVVSREWKSLAAEDKTQYEAMANIDRDRYYREKAAYKGPWKILNVKDPRAPKKPMSAFLAFSNERRKSVAEANPGLGNGEISGLLSKLWKESPEEIKNQYRSREAHERKKFKVAFAEWEKKCSMSTGSIEEDEDSQLPDNCGGSRGGDDDSSRSYHKKPPSESKEGDFNESLPPLFQRQQSSTTQLNMFQHAASTNEGQFLEQNQFSMFGNVAPDLESIFPILPTQQQLIPLPPGPLPNQPLLSLHQGAGSLPLPAQSFTGLASMQQSGGEIPVNPILTMSTPTQNPALATMEDYRSLDPFIETDTGGFLAAFAALEKEHQSKKSDQNE